MSLKEIDVFVGGRICGYLSEWNKLTRDPAILGSVRGYKIPFTDEPIELAWRRNPRFSVTEERIIDAEIQLLIKQRIVSDAGP
jgi:hypothetical protein